MRNRALLSTRRLRATALLLSLAVAVSGATVALASPHHHGHHNRRHHGHTHHTAKASYKAACYRTWHHKRKSVACSTRKTTGQTAHGSRVHSLHLLHLIAATNQSNNWSGYNQGTLEQGSKLFNSISGQWTVPTATQHTSGEAEYSSDWIGIGGGCVDANCTVTDPTLIQTGTEQDVSSGGSASYSAWWEVIPGPSLTITSMTVHPGDRMSATIAEVVNDTNVWTITITDLTDGESYSVTVPYTSAHDTAEWIQETPLVIGTGAGFAAQPNLTMPAFDLASTNGAPANLKSSEEMELTDSSGNVIATPSAPDSDADGFNVCAWATSCSPPSS